MSQSVVCISEFEKVGTLVRLLKTTPHHGFPVLAFRGGGGARAGGEAAAAVRAPSEQAGVLGVILRSQITTILAHGRFEDAPSEASRGRGDGGYVDSFGCI